MKKGFIEIRSKESILTKNTLRIFLIIILGCLSLRPSTAYSQEDALSWEDCLTETKKNNPGIISALEGINIEKADKDISASVFYPQLNATMNAATSKTSAAGSGSEISDLYSYGVSGIQLIFDGFKSINEVKTAAENLKAAQYAYRFTSAEVRFKLRSAFVSLLRAQELARVAEEILKIRKDNLILITLRHQAGLEHKGALLTAEANAVEAKYELSQAKRNVEFMQRLLTGELGRKEFKQVTVKGEFIVNETAKEKPDFEELIKVNPSVLQAIAKKNAGSFGIKSAYGNFAPQILGSAGAKKKSSHWPPEDEQWNLELGVSLPLFEGGLKAAKVSQAQAEYKQAMADETGIRNAAIVTLEQTWAGLQDSIETVEARHNLLKASEERAKIAQAQYSTGFINFDNWIIIEDELVRAKKAYLEAQSEALLAEAYWIQAKGETLEYAK
ncbi:MAG: TolC family protein [Candidatus Omnitrophica bacterium]|nr:TolC family protein [Candidatus Omnitrophota bacterium]